MKLKFPLDKYYDCKRITQYKELDFEAKDKYLIVSYEQEDKGIFLDVKSN